MRILLALALPLLAACTRPSAERPPEKSSAMTQPTASFHSMHARSLNGKDVDLAQYAGKVVLVVNTASASISRRPGERTR